MRQLGDTEVESFHDMTAHFLRRGETTNCIWEPYRGKQRGASAEASSVHFVQFPSASFIPSRRNGENRQSAQFSPCCLGKCIRMTEESPVDSNNNKLCVPHRGVGASQVGRTGIIQGKSAPNSVFNRKRFFLFRSIMIFGKIAVSAE